MHFTCTRRLVLFQVRKRQVYGAQLTHFPWITSLHLQLSVIKHQQWHSSCKRKLRTVHPNTFHFLFVLPAMFNSILLTEVFDAWHNSTLFLLFLYGVTTKQNFTSKSIILTTSTDIIVSKLIHEHIQKLEKKATSKQWGFALERLDSLLCIPAIWHISPPPPRVLLFQIYVSGRSDLSIYPK